MNARPGRFSRFSMRTSGRFFASLSARVSARTILFAVLGAAILAAILPVGDAFARVGGGQSYGGGGSSGGSFGVGGGGHGDGGLIYLLIWLIFRHPYIGIPVVAAVVIFKLVTMNSGANKVYRSQGPSGGSSLGSPARSPGPRSGGLRLAEAVRQWDPNFSEPAFLDFVQVVYARAQQERAGGHLDVLAAYLADSVREQLLAQSRGVTSVRDVIFGATVLSGARRAGSDIQADVFFETNYTELRGTSEKQLLVSERWTFKKSASTLSPAPERLVALSCPGCGNPTETRPDGTCVHCDSPVGAGRVLWQVTSIQAISLKPVEPPPLQLGGAEEGIDLPTVFDPNLAAALRAFRSRHADFDTGQFTTHARDVFVALQAAWDSGRWEGARPFETDHLFQTHRYWMDRYARFGLRNRLDKVEVMEVVPVKISQDAFYEAITVRIMARMLDWTVDREGRVVAGDAKKLRAFSEYWTFIRAIGVGGQEHAADRCPSCGASLDRVSQTGVCGYCDAKITSGRHDWVLSSIEQDEAYRG
jgi:predicted lipid-binding transport protein (Tim44 family)